MNLQLSTNSPINTILSDTEGKPLYRIVTPGKWTRKATTIFRISPATDVTEATTNPAPEASENTGNEQHGQGVPGNPGEQEMACIYWHDRISSNLIYKGEMVEFQTFMPRSGFWGINRSFNAPDGTSYKWHMGWLTCYLVLDDGSKPARCIARFHQRNILKKTKAYLEIDPAGTPMVDLIVITWVFVETRRRDLERKYTTSHDT